MDFSIVTYNCMVDACSRCGEVVRIPMLLEDMTKLQIEPNLITYSSILKGYCNENKIDKAFEVMQSMKQSTKFRPDEIMYNSLLDGCARQGLYERGLQLLADMQQEGIAPSNFTLSILVKMASRGRQLESAFELSSDLSKKYGFRLNVHVFSNLIHACVAHKDIPRALGVLEQMLNEKVRPDVRTYKLLLQACVSVGDNRAAEGLLRSALGLQGVHPRLAKFHSKLLQPEYGLPKDVISETLEGITGPKTDEALMMQLLQDIKRKLPSFNVDPRIKLRITKRAIHQPRQ